MIRNPAIVGWQAREPGQPHDAKGRLAHQLDWNRIVLEFMGNDPRDAGRQFFICLQRENRALAPLAQRFEREAENRFAAMRIVLIL